MRRTALFICLMALLNSGTAWSQELPLLVARQGYPDILLIYGKIVTNDDRQQILCFQELLALP